MALMITIKVAIRVPYAIALLAPPLRMGIAFLFVFVHVVSPPEEFYALMQWSHISGSSPLVTIYIKKKYISLLLMASSSFLS